MAGAPSFKKKKTKTRLHPRRGQRSPSSPATRSPARATPQGRLADRPLSGAYADWSLVCGSVFFFQAEDGIRDYKVTGVQTCALPISSFRIAAGTRLAELEKVHERK